MNPTKKQKILLDFIDGFTKGQGYSPTYREIMQALGYKSVSTVAKHIDNLVARGWLVKREGEARSLEVIVAGRAGASVDETNPGASDDLSDGEWWHGLEREIAKRQQSDDPQAAEELAILRQALAIVQGEESSEN